MARTTESERLLAARLQRRGPGGGEMVFEHRGALGNTVVLERYLQGWLGRPYALFPRRSLFT